ncbi:MAG: hypothetical protein A2077_01085 [Nitrospirae bacterium GWC2_46_6]|nr:MAG: hypothetical protein A2077_01085 [Nitrospirae bacterium GWC2_46_6]OGW21094.1 MAG: hypothetical protein A2Z82_07775 [Nitrospirae bacterium GWA2_46_11]HAK88302.1 hypothetical protein [Nitrospiraceae bacterium]HCL81481.1 hypothetical protein [Nitrospiraceae bacterium]HCZ12730.1 hypothetical protein [Nitrospiraceae bacterium]
MSAIRIYTIGFTQKSAEQFFDTLLKAGVRKIVDARLNNSSQLSGFAKKDDLKYFLKIIGNIEYIHMPILAPTEEILVEYRKKKLDWETYKKKFLELLEKRKIEKIVSPSELDRACLLCSEHLPRQCHRLLVAEYLKNKWDDVKIEHLT